nr:hypothetical protein [Tanacetum cinerariifolium]
DHGWGFVLGKVVEVMGSSVRVVEWSGVGGIVVLQVGGKFGWAKVLGLSWEGVGKVVGEQEKWQEEWGGGVVG